MKNIRYAIFALLISIAICQDLGFSIIDSSFHRIYSPRNKYIVPTGDLDRDGVDDFIFINLATNYFSPRLYPGDTLLDSTVFIYFFGFAPTSSYPLEYWFTGYACADFNGDGSRDVILSFTRRSSPYNGFVDMWFGRPTGSCGFWNDSWHFFDDSSAQLGIVGSIGDDNGDGFDDFIVISTHNRPSGKQSYIYLFYGASSGANLVHQWSFEPHNYAKLWHIGDFDGDSLPELLILMSVDTLWDKYYICIIQSDSQFIYADTNCYDDSLFVNFILLYRDMPTLDINHDGKDDIYKFLNTIGDGIHPLLLSYWNLNGDSFVNHVDTLSLILVSSHNLIEKPILPLSYGDTMIYSYKEISPGLYMLHFYNFISPTSLTIYDSVMAPTHFFVRLGDINRDGYNEFISDVGVVNFNPRSHIAENVRFRENINIYPNPFKTFCKLWSGETKIEVVEFFDLRGNKVNGDIIRINENSILWKPRKLSPGIYFVRVKMNDKQYIRKLLYMP